MNCNRRELIKAGAALGAGIAVGGLPLELFAAESAKPQTATIVKITNPGLAARDLDLNLVSAAIDKAVAKLTGASSAEAAWGKMFGPDDVVGIKINSVGGKGISSHPNLVKAVIGSLETAGVKTNNIMVWDALELTLMGAGFRPNKGKTGARFVDLKWSGFESNPRKISDAEIRLPKILTQEITAIINIPILKDHNTCGVTFAMKNHYGSVDEPSRMHPYNCDPYLGLLNNQPEIRKKTRLIIGDATKAQYQNGPAFNPSCVWNPGTILAGFDPVAMDRIAAQMLEAKRAEKGVKSFKQVGLEPTYIESAARLGLGVSDPKKIKIVEA